MHAGVGEAKRLVAREDPRAHRDVEAGPVVDQRDHRQDRLQHPLVGAADGEHDAELRRAERSGLAAAARTSSASSSGVALTGDSKRADWLQKWQSSGQPPVLADRIPSTSTSVTAPRQADFMGQRGEGRHCCRRQGCELAQLLGVELAALFQQRVAGVSQQGT